MLNIRQEALGALMVVLDDNFIKLVVWAILDGITIHIELLEELLVDEISNRMQ